MKRLSSFLSLFSSVSTLVCCALPALFVVLGAGATFAGLLSIFPQLIWISERKLYFIVFGAVMLAIAGFLQWNSVEKACPTDKSLSGACSTTRDWSRWVYFLSLGVFLIGSGFALIPQWLD